MPVGCGGDEINNSDNLSNGSRNQSVKRQNEKLTIIERIT